MLRVLAATLILLTATSSAWTQSAGARNVVLQWNNATLQAVRDSRFAPPVVARALAIIHECIYEAWAPYSDRALGPTLGGQLRRPRGERDAANVEKAISFASYRCAIDLFASSRISLFDPLMKNLGNDTGDLSLDRSTPQGVGNIAAASVLASRSNDGANQAGRLTSTGLPYGDYSGYTPKNPPSTVPVNPSIIQDPNRWQPLQYADATGAFITQQFAVPFWGKVKPFALGSGDEFRSLLALLKPFRSDNPSFVSQAQELVDLSANLTDENKMMAEYWADGPRSETPPGHWNLLAQYVSVGSRHSVEDDVKMFFALNNALCDAGIVAWDAKIVFDSVRPVTAIPYVFAGKRIRSWGGPGRGVIEMDGRDWKPYQAATFPTPPFPEFISGHSTFSAAAATVLLLITGSDRFGANVSFAPGSSSIEPGITPKGTVTLVWPTFSAAADQAGLSRRYGGIHFSRGDFAGRLTGRLVGWKAWEKAFGLWSGRGNGG